MNFHHVFFCRGNASSDTDHRGDLNEHVAREADPLIGQRALRRLVERSVPPDRQPGANGERYLILVTETVGGAQAPPPLRGRFADHWRPLRSLLHNPRSR